MAGLRWLVEQPGAESWPFCLTFVRGVGERAVLAGLGVDPGDAVPSAAAQAPTAPGIIIMRSGDWTVALEDSIPPRGTRPEVLRRLSAGTEAVAVYQDIGKGNDELAHAVDGEIITAVTTSVPTDWSGTQPDRLRPLADELGLDGDDDHDLTDIEILLLLAESAFGLSLDEADLRHPLLTVSNVLPDATPGAPAAASPTAPEAVDMGLVRSHVRGLLEQGVPADVIAAQAEMTTLGLDNLLSGVTTWLPDIRAQQILAIEAPPSSAP